jgi:4-alpha-glucanotransferase
VHERVRDRRALLEALDLEGLKPVGCDGSEDSYGDALAVAIHVFLARSNSALVVVQAEDLVGMVDPVNVPGTSDEHANWQRKMSCDLDGIFRSAQVRRLLDAVQAARTG